jgi:hypothetical protein
MISREAGYEAGDVLKAVRGVEVSWLGHWQSHVTWRVAGAASCLVTCPPQKCPDKPAHRQRPLQSRAPWPLMQRHMPPARVTPNLNAAECTSPRRHHAPVAGDGAAGLCHEHEGHAHVTFTCLLNLGNCPEHPLPGRLRQRGFLLAPASIMQPSHAMHASGGGRAGH